MSRNPTDVCAERFKVYRAARERHERAVVAREQAQGQVSELESKLSLTETRDRVAALGDALVDQRRPPRPEANSIRAQLDEAKAQLEALRYAEERAAGQLERLLERRDVDRPKGVVHVRRVYVDGRIRLYGKQTRSLRAVPLPLRAGRALDELPARLDTRLLFPGERGGHLNLHGWRADEWTPAVKAAGLEHRSPYALRHTFATFAIAAGVSLFELSGFMGTSVEQIDRTYGHLLPDSIDRARVALDAFVSGACPAEEAEDGR